MLAQPRPRGRRPLPPPPRVVVPAMALHGFGLRLRNLRRKHGMSAHRLSLACGFKGDAVSNWERCLHFPSLSHLLRLRAALGCDWSTLLGE